MVTIVRDRVQDGIKKGLTLAQIRQADPVKGYRRRFGADSGPVDDQPVRRGGLQEPRRQVVRTLRPHAPGWRRDRHRRVDVRQPCRAGPRRRAGTARPPAAPAGRAGRPAAAAPRAAAPIDLTGYWVSVITEDWRWRMVTPPKGDYASLPINMDAKKVADAWDPAKDEAAGEACKAYGAPGPHAPARRVSTSPGRTTPR